MFEVGSQYTRADIYRLLQVPLRQQRGDWLNGYHKHGQCYFVFCNIGSAGRTGHDYANRWESADRLIWYGKTKSHFQQQSIRDLISERYTTLIFFRSDDRSPFEYAGIGHPLPHKNTYYPVRIDWKIERSSYILGDFNVHSRENKSAPLQRDPFLDAIESLNVHRGSDVEAPYKALLLLTMIARAEAGLGATVRYQDLMPHLRALMDRWNLAPESVDPRLPFWHLQEPHLWEIPDVANIPRGANGRPTAGMLVESGATGRIPSEHWTTLCCNPACRNSARRMLLSRFWEPAEYETVLAATAAAANAIGNSPPIAPLTHATRLNEETEDMTVRLVDDARAILSMRESDFDAYSAYGEVVDNSIQAESSFSRIRVNASSQRSGRGYRAINEIAFGDDGTGMNVDTLHRCLQLGYSTRYNDRSGIGRFGVGMTLAAINQCKRVEVYSRQNGSSWHWTYIDLDEIEETGEASIALPSAKDIPDQYRDLVGVNSGTLVIWSKYDRQPESADSMTEEMRIWFGRTYRRFIWSDFTISLDGTEVHAIDPLYFNWKDTRFPNDPPAQIFDPIKIGWPVGPGSNNESEIVIRMSLVNENLRPNQGSGNSRECRDRYIDRNQGISIMRNDREVFYGPIPYWPGSAWFVEKDRWWGCEISFNAILDRAFTVKNIKRGAVPVKQLKETIYEQIKPTRETVLKEIDRVWDLAKEKKIQETTTSNGLQTGHSAAEQVAKKNPGQKSARPPKNSAQVINEILPGLSEEEKAKWMAKWQSQPFTIHDGSWNGPAFFEVTHLGGSAVIRYNTNHPFIKELYSIQERLGRSQDSNPDAFMIRGFIDLMTIAFAKAEATWEEDTEVRAGQFLQDLELSWGQFLKSYLSTFLKEYGGQE